MLLLLASLVCVAILVACVLIKMWPPKKYAFRCQVNSSGVFPDLFISKCPRLKLVSNGLTETEARTSLEKAVKSYVESYAKHPSMLEAAVCNKAIPLAPDEFVVTVSLKRVGFLWA